MCVNVLLSGLAHPRQKIIHIVFGFIHTLVLLEIERVDIHVEHSATTCVRGEVFIERGMSWIR